MMKLSLSGKSARSRLSIFFASAIFLSGILATSCGGNETDTTKPVVQKVSSRVKDRKAYSLGEEHARVLLENADNEDYVQDGLLDIRARVSNIESNLGRQSAVDYERGFTDYVRKNCDSLARIIF